MDKARLCETLKHLKQLCQNYIEILEQLETHLHSDTYWTLLLLSHLDDTTL